MSDLYDAIFGLDQGDLPALAVDNMDHGIVSTDRFVTWGAERLDIYKERKHGVIHIVVWENRQQKEQVSFAIGAFLFAGHSTDGRYLSPGYKLFTISVDTGVLIWEMHWETNSMDAEGGRWQKTGYVQLTNAEYMYVWRQLSNALEGEK